MLSTKNKNLVVAIVCGIFFCFALVFYGSQPLLSDVSYFVAADQRILQGAVPYVDIFENNPPLAFWFTLPAVWLARLLNQNAETVFVVFVLLLNAAILSFIWKLHRQDSRGSHYRQYLILILTVVFSFCLAFGFGQREYFATLLLLPYICSVALRSNRQVLPQGFKIPLGLLAGIGVCFKPYFILIPALVEIFLAVQCKNWRLLFQTEVLVAVGVVVLYPVIVWWFYPTYFTEILPLTLLTYSAYQASYAAIIMSSTFLIFVGAAILTLTASFWTAARDRGILVWMAAALAGVVIHFVQHMGWPYHLLPGLAFITIALLLYAMQMQIPVLKMGICFIVLLCIGAGLTNYRQTQDKSFTRFDTLLNGVQPRRMMMLTYELGAAFPFMPAHNIEWVGHYQSLWPMAAIEKHKLSDSEGQTVLKKMALTIALDILEQKPDFVIVDHRPFSDRSEKGDHSPIVQLSSIVEFKSAWSYYRQLNDDGAFQLWQRQ